MSARSLNRFPEQTRWSSDALSNIQATPWFARQRHDPEVVFREPAAAAAAAETAAPPSLRRFRIQHSDLSKHGYTDGCVQCQHIQRSGKTRAGTQHSDVCRARVIEAISRSDVGRQRLSDYDARLTQSMAEHVEHADRAAPPAVPGGDGGHPSGPLPRPPSIMPDRHQRGRRPTETPLPAVRGWPGSPRG